MQPGDVRETCADGLTSSRRSLSASDVDRGWHRTLVDWYRATTALGGRRRQGCSMTNLITPLIMCGGAGTRLWPASREDRPKQFLALMGTRSTFQDTVLRVSDPALFGRPIVINQRGYRFLVAEQLAAIASKPMSCWSGTA